MECSFLVQKIIKHRPNNKVLVFYTPRNIFMSFAALLFIFAGCKNSSSTTDDYSKYLNQHIITDMFPSVIHREQVIGWTNFREKYRNITVVYLQDNCSPCYPKFIEWHRRMEQIAKADDYTVLFIINTRNYEDFLNNVRLYGECDNRYYYVMDPGKMFLGANGQIPIWVIMDQSILINENDQIKMIGAPFANDDRTKVFHIVTGVDTQQSDKSSQ